MLLATFVTHCRAIMNDGPTSNFSGIEDWLMHERNTVNGTNTMFFLMNKRLVASSLAVYLNGVNVTATVTPELREGYFTIAPAPTIITNFKFFWKYYWQHLTDAEFTTCINRALAACSLAIIDIASPVEIPDVMLNVVSTFVQAFANMAMAERCADYYPVSAGGKSFDKNVLYQQYWGLYQTHIKQAEAERDSYYSGNSQQFAPSIADDSGDPAIASYDRFFDV